MVFCRHSCTSIGVCIPELALLMRVRNVAQAMWGNGGGVTFVRVFINAFRSSITFGMYSDCIDKSLKDFLASSSSKSFT